MTEKYPEGQGVGLEVMDSKYIQQLEGVIRQMLKPIRNIPFPLVIEAISGKKVIPFDPGRSDDREVLELLKSAASLAGSKINEEGISSRRVNEVGNIIEHYVRDALDELKCQAAIPNGKSAGYPDIEFRDRRGNFHYVECKTYNLKNVDVTMRSFYLSPSEEFKVTKDAHHFGMSFEIQEVKRAQTSNMYLCRGWKILALDKLPVDVKYEFNSNNRRLYKKELILAEGPIG